MNIVHLCDCMDFMRDKPDNCYDLAIVDPPYGIGGGSNVADKSNRDWDANIPGEYYFSHLCRISQNQIIWGGNYMSMNIPFNSTHTIIWDKENGDSFMSDGEIAFTSFNKQTTKFFRLFWMSNMMKAKEKPLIHPTQKPVALYKWLLTNYAKPRQTIFDSHVGSGSIRIACHDMGFDFEGCEIDEDYWKTQEKRYQRHILQDELFDKQELQNSIYMETK